MFCGSCGNNITEEDVLFCPKCGTRVAGDSQPVTPIMPVAETFTPEEEVLPQIDISSIYNEEQSSMQEDIPLPTIQPAPVVQTAPVEPQVIPVQQAPVQPQVIPVQQAPVQPQVIPVQQAPVQPQVIPVQQAAPFSANQGPVSYDADDEDDGDVEISGKKAAKIAIGVFFIVAIVIVIVVLVIMILKSSGDKTPEDPGLNNVTPITTQSQEAIGTPTTEAAQEVEHAEEEATNTQAELPSAGDLIGEKPVSDDYILPYSDSVLLTEADLVGLTQEELRIARNELYARHGRMFTDEALNAYFSSKSWYQGTIPADEFDESVLNAVELANKDTIVLYEEKMGYR